ncbi:unnamed protein product [Rotaria sp. Silwood1]|nr:unnamed protein product [Rotaria sp. Silwood1]CAF3494243.1 unnamed protein product [Rotaria sp. Silwood1]CAF3496391.1 unnamed protein product [Rotaria sp. Silwood1]CAF3511602.1 unnamed protein product [Rotaria sp. Silwood1]CAF4501592.1 unnamed protein product [Rotaria sp. Silwood1]
MRRSIFELFPDELILDIFKYFDIRDLYQSFYGLNSRLNAIVQSKKNLSLKFSSPDDMDDPYLDLFTPQIVKLIIDHSSFIDFELFSSLHSLILYSPSEDQLEQIYLCKFPYLIHLEFGIMTDKLFRRSLYEFFHCKRFPSLQTCIFHHENNAVSLNRYRQIWSNASTLRTVWSNSIDISLCSDIGLNIGEKILSIDVMHSSLKRFDICCVKDGPSILDIDHFLIQTPNLEKFKIASSEIYHSYECLQQLASILQRRLVHLRQFDCELQCIMSTEEIDNIHQLHPCFNRIQCQLKYGGRCVRLYTE